LGFTYEFTFCIFTFKPVREPGIGLSDNIISIPIPEEDWSGIVAKLSWVMKVWTRRLPQKQSNDGGVV